jgi:hypothetical protein
VISSGSSFGAGAGDVVGTGANLAQPARTPATARYPSEDISGSPTSNLKKHVDLVNRPDDIDDVQNCKTR